MKLLLLVIGCGVALVVAHPAEDACAAMRARLLPSLEPSARADAGALRACDADSDGAVDAAELVSCVQRAFGSTARLDRAQIEERIHCFRSIMADTPLAAGQFQTADIGQLRHLGLGSGSVSGGDTRSGGLQILGCDGESQLGQILTGIVRGQLQTAYDALITWYVSALSQSSGLLNSLVQNVGLVLGSLLSGISLESLVYLVTELVRSTNNALAQSDEDALISSLFQIASVNRTAARTVIQERLDAGVLNGAIQDELQRIIDDFDTGFLDSAVNRTISLLTGCDTDDTQPQGSIFTQLLGVYDLLIQLRNFVGPGPEFFAAKDLFLPIYNQSREMEPPLDENLMQIFDLALFNFGNNAWQLTLLTIVRVLVFPCNYDNAFPARLIDAITKMVRVNLIDPIDSLFNHYENRTAYTEVISHLRLARIAYNSSNFNGVLDEYRNILEFCVSLADI